MLKRLARDMDAWGQEGLPREILCGGGSYRLVQTLKHDFVAGTGLYQRCDGQEPTEAGPAKIVLKTGRKAPLLGIPMGWLGWITTHNEYVNLLRLRDVPQTPRLLERFGKCGFLYEFIEGASLDDGVELPSGFFDKLHALLEQVHAKKIVYFDLNKRGNVLLGADGLPYLIDFQISLYMGDFLLLLPPLSRAFRRRLFQYDIYHIYKHKRKLQPEELTAEQGRIAEHVGIVLRVHRAIAWPYREGRRALLRYLYKKGLLKRKENTKYSRETDPARYAK